MRLLYKIPTTMYGEEKGWVGDFLFKKRKENLIIIFLEKKVLILTPLQLTRKESP